MRTYNQARWGAAQPLALSKCSASLLVGRSASRDNCEEGVGICTDRCEDVVQGRLTISPHASAQVIPSMFANGQ